MHTSHLFITFTTPILNFSAYISANCLRVKAQPWRPEPKPTLPLLGSTCKHNNSNTFLVHVTDRHYSFDRLIQKNHAHELPYNTFICYVLQPVYIAINKVYNLNFYSHKFHRMHVKWFGSWNVIRVGIYASTHTCQHSLNYISELHALNTARYFYIAHKTHITKTPYHNRGTSYEFEQT